MNHFVHELINLKIKSKYIALLIKSFYFEIIQERWHVITAKVLLFVT